ncbi:hypothetical protein FSP39_017241 [Pinctada imbricata]|uniref:CABIT domain-containing protein n=1 Tax=Pinctada imbricata TaxID=66713 RepID=A0AA88XT05_PINIB|nr:hypothetical protein FSP39_017241 [Pinctada imbricata]
MAVTLNGMMPSVPKPNPKSPPRPVKDFVWDEKPKYLKDLLTLHRLPFTAKVHKGDLSRFSPAWKASAGDSTEDILQVLEIRRRKLVVCKKMQWDRKTGTYSTIDKQQDIPVTYKGWFEVLPEEGHPVEYFDSIQAITNIKPRRFLLRTSIVGYQLSIDNGVSCWMPLELRPGLVLTTGIVYMDHKKTKSNVKGFLKRILKPGKQTKKDQELKYLQCFDIDGKEIMIPLIMTGVFSPVGEPSESNYDAVYEMQDLILAFNLPVKAQLIHEEEEDQTAQNNPSRVNTNRGSYRRGNESQRKSTPSEQFQSDPPQEQIYANSVVQDVELPTRKESKKQKGQGILEKLSVRSKARKERASLKQLQEEGVFSSRLSKSELNLEDYFKADDKNENKKNTIEPTNTESEETLCDPVANNVDENVPVYSFGVETSGKPMQNRDLPPIPKAKELSHEKDTLYEELPIAPKPPQSPYLYRSHSHDDDDDGYMCPAQLRRPDSRRSSSGSNLRSKPPIAPRDYTYSKSRKRGEIQSSSVDYGYNETSPIDIDTLFNFSSEAEGYEPSNVTSPYATGQLYQATAIAQTKREGMTPYEERRLSADDTALSRGNILAWNKIKSRSQKSLNVDANVTVRSHNVRKVRNAADVFNVGENLARNSGQSRVSVVSPIANPYGSVADSNQDQRLSFYEPENFDRRSLYAASEPGIRRYQRTLSSAGLSDIYGNGRNGDDSAFSGDYGYHGDSEYSYSEYSEFRDDGWRPPSDISNLSVQEVSKSLRYIGMKDRVVLRLANEQIDGQLLCSLDKQLLQEGFPELNALEIKKIMDFINGWRPKK